MSTGRISQAIRQEIDHGKDESWIFLVLRIRRIPIQTVGVAKLAPSEQERITISFWINACYVTRKKDKEIRVL